jgi:hypothetical protein
MIRIHISKVAAVLIAVEAADVVNEFGERILHPPGRLHVTDLAAVTASTSTNMSLVYGTTANSMST